MRQGVPQQVLRAIDSLPLFSRCTRKEQIRILSLGTTVSVRDGTSLTIEGERGFEFFVTVAGAARCVRGGRTVARFAPGDFFGEIALLDGGSRTATVLAESPMEVMVFSHREFDGLLESVPCVAQRMLPVVVARTFHGSDGVCQTPPGTSLIQLHARTGGELFTGVAP